MNIKYDIERIKSDLRDEYMAASLVGFTEDTPDIMDIEFSAPGELIEMARAYGLRIDDYIIKEDEETDRK